MVLSRLPHPSKVETVKKFVLSRPLQMAKVEPVKFSSFTTTDSSLNENCEKLVLSRPPHPPKVEVGKN